MSDQQVIYDMRLKDGVSGGLNLADAAAHKFEGTLGSVKGLLEGVGIGLLTFKGMEFLGEANEAWEKMEFSISQVETALESTKGAAGLTFEEVKKGAEDMSHNLKFTQSEILGMQSVLLTFPAVTKETFASASTIIADMSTRLGQDLKSSTIQLGKALQDPERGITALRRVGVNFNETQVETIKHLVETNQQAAAQAMILKELAFEFGGSAAAAAEADKSFRLDKTMEENKVALGEMLDKIKEELLPTLIKVADGFGQLLHWIKENASWLKSLTAAIGTAWLTFKLFTAGPAIMLALENSIVAAATAGTGLGASMTAALGPIGLVAAALGGIIYFYEEAQALRERYENHEASLPALQKEGQKQETEHLSALTMADTEKNKDVAAKKIASKELIELYKQQQDLEYKLNHTSGAANYAIDSQLEKLKAQISVAKSFTGKDVIKGAAPAKPAIPKLDKPDKGTKATAARNVTINVTIKDLIGVYNSNVTNIKNMTSDVRAAVVNALTSAVNDFQVVAERS